jgi:3-phosphoinositide dependent protein kinase-1
MGVADFDIGDQLGEGAFGQVCLCMLRTTGMQYAIKIIEVIHAKRHGGLQQVKTERDVLILLNHPSIVKLHFTFHDTEHLYIVTELASGGELFGHIKRLGSCHINCARWLTGELLNALEYMHGVGVVHRDLKPENILLDELGHIKLIDFGSSRRLSGEGDADAPRFVGTAQYVSPEVLNDEDAAPPADMWALGCIVFQLLSGSSPFTADSEYLTFKKIEALEYAFPAHFPPPAQALIASLLQLDPAVRPTAALPLKAHAFFQECEPPLDFASLTATPPPRRRRRRRS